MKKIFVLMAMVLCSVAFAVAQPRAIGGRLGYGVDFSYQHSVGKNMINLEVGTPGFYAIFAAVTHDWIFPINSWEEEGSWNWYAGVGGGLGYDFFKNHEYFFVGVAGRIGVEYNFWFPLQLSLDWRPVIGPSMNKDGVQYYHYGLWQGGIALGVRYLFH